LVGSLVAPRFPTGWDPCCPVAGHLWDRRLPEEVPQPELRAALDAALRGPDGRRALEVVPRVQRWWLGAGW